MRFLSIRDVLLAVTVIREASSLSDPLPPFQRKENAPARTVKAHEDAVSATAIIAPGTTHHIKRKFEDVDADVSVRTLSSYKDLRATMAIIPDDINKPPMVIYPRGLGLVFAGVIGNFVSVPENFLCLERC